jgi:exopolysaccharide biosynthesis polyprenyl glycosylphosphotransferase
VGALAMVDVACFVIARAITSTGTAGVVATLTPPGDAHELSLAAALLFGTTISGSYRRGDNGIQVRRLFLAAVLAGALPLWSHIWGNDPAAAIETFLVAFAPLFATLVVMRSAFDAAARRWSRRRGKTALPRAVLVGTTTDCLTQIARSQVSGGDFEVLGFIDIAAKPDPRALGSVAAIERILLDERIEVVILSGLPSPDATSRVLRAAAVTECTVFASAPQLELPAVRPNVIKRQGQPMLELRPVGLRIEQLLCKRLVDLIGAATLLVLLMPLMAALAALIALDSPGPVIFAQRRLGRFGRPIRCYKFRSMYADAEARLLSDPDLYRLYVENSYKVPSTIDTRITKVGRFLRRTSLDELPQLWNVLKGEMSLVGPRPIVPDEIHHYNGQGPFLLSLKPGLTGEWQVSGRSAVPYPQRADVELGYVEGWSLWRDASILIRTLPAVLAARGAH